jgi:hypothetical protein
MRKLLRQREGLDALAAVAMRKGITVEGLTAQLEALADKGTPQVEQ